MWKYIHNDDKVNLFAEFDLTVESFGTPTLKWVHSWKSTSTSWIIIRIFLGHKGSFSITVP